MRKTKLILLFLIILAQFIATSCSTNVSNSNNVNTPKVSTALESDQRNDSVLSQEDIENSKKEPMESEITLTWFMAGSYNELSEYKNKTYPQQTKKVQYTELCNMLKNPISYNNWEMQLANNYIIQYQFEDIDYYRNASEKDIRYYYFSDLGVGNSFYVSMLEAPISVMLDYNRNIITLIKNEFEMKIISGVYKFKSGFNVKELTFIGGYKENGKYIVSFIDKSNIMYFVDAETMELIKTKEITGWKYCSSYLDYDFRTESDELYIYFISEKDRKLMKLKLPEDEVVYEKNIDNRIKGNIEKIESDGSGMIFLLTNNDTSNSIYSVREDDFGYISVKEKYESGSLFENISDFKFYEQNPNSMWLILFEKSKEIPVNKVDAYGLEWEELYVQ